MARDSELGTAPVDSNGQSFNDYGYSDNPNTSLDARRQERAAMVPTWKRSTVTSPRETQEQNEGKDGEKSVVKKQTYTPGTSDSRHAQQDDTRPKYWTRPPSNANLTFNH